MLMSKTQQALFFFCATLLTGLCFARAGIISELSLNFMGISAITLILGPRLALLCSAVASVPLLLIGVISLHTLPHELLLGLMLPSIVSYGIYRSAPKVITHNIYLFVIYCASFAGIIAFGVKTLLIALYLQLSGEFTWQQIGDNYFVISWLFVIPEAMLNGIIIIFLAIHRPRWIALLPSHLLPNKK